MSTVLQKCDLNNATRKATKDESGKMKTMSFLHFFKMLFLMDNILSFASYSSRCRCTSTFGYDLTRWKCASFTEEASAVAECIMYTNWRWQRAPTMGHFARPMYKLFQEIDHMRPFHHHSTLLLCEYFAYDITYVAVLHMALFACSKPAYVRKYFSWPTGSSKAKLHPTWRC